MISKITNAYRRWLERMIVKNLSRKTSEYIHISSASSSGIVVCSALGRAVVCSQSGRYLIAVAIKHRNEYVFSVYARRRVLGMSGAGFEHIGITDYPGVVMRELCSAHETGKSYIRWSWA